MASDELTDEALSGPVVDRRTTTALLGAAGLGGLAGCLGGGGDDGGDGETDASGGDSGGDDGGDTEETTAPPEDKQGGRLQAGWFTGSIEDLDPPYISVGQYFQLAANVFSGLTTFNSDLTIRGDLAEDWTVEDGGATFTFQLRDDVTFHNGAEFTADDVLYTIRRTIEEEAPAASKLSTLQPIDEGGVEVGGDYEVTVRFEDPNAVALVYLSRGPGRAATIVSQDAIEEMGAEQYNVTPVGTGPFQVVDHEVGTSVTLDAYDDYFETDEDGNALPYLDGIDVQPIPEPSSIVNALRSGDIHFSNLLPLQNLSEIESSDEAVASAQPGINWTGFAMNQNREPFGSRDARLGIAKSIDNEAFVEAAYFGNALPDNGVISKGTAWAWREDKPDTQAHAPEEAQELLESSGAEGASFSILANSGNLRAAKAMRQQLNSAGFDVDIDQVTSSTYWSRYAELDYDVTISGSIIDPDPEQGLWNFYRLPDEGGVWNWVDYESQEVHDMLAEQRSTMDREERKGILHDIEDQLIEDVPHAYLVHQDDIAGVRNEVKGFNHIPGLRNFHTVYLDE
ncbi:ABC transporter substrate-binding protein [Halobaculum sp. WSA2]|uniref:ABC transporter substrate-binding protein n=1 Tax=Halobaculum saliterrae TaxID=2073113 RepID=A0A6B0SM47_9EURY|nr:ABC transporter substrate-binding protein [Halobaculum saliterrae]MXR39988.1 ABC transporter substrate-binding protein [Halobaculum saliterrae]